MIFRGNRIQLIAKYQRQNVKTLPNLLYIFIILQATNLLGLEVRMKVRIHTNTKQLHWIKFSKKQERKVRICTLPLPHQQQPQCFFPSILSRCQGNQNNSQVSKTFKSYSFLSSKNNKKVKMFCMKFASTFYITVQEVPQSPDSNSFPSHYVVAFFQRIYQPEF